MKNKLVTIALSSVMMMSAAAFADCDPQFYVGGELQSNKYKGAKTFTSKAGTVVERLDKKPFFGKSGAGASIVAGTRLNENVGIELGATGLSKSKFHFKQDATLKNNSSLKTKGNNLYADVMGYAPVSEQVDLIAALGVGRLTSKVSGTLEARHPISNRVLASENVSLKTHKTGVRVGAGVGYKIDKNLTARLMVRHQKGNKYVKSVTSAGLGLLYQF